MPIIAPENIKQGDIATAIDRAVHFLQSKQRPDGGIRSYKPRKRDMSGPRHPDNSVFATMWVAYCMGFADHPQAAAIRERALGFLEAHIKEPGIWHYFIPEQNFQVDPDLDDTSCISVLLRERHPSIRAGLNVPVLLEFRDAGGRFYTWMRPDKRKAWQRWLPAKWQPAKWAEQEVKNDVDSIVNANVLWYLGERKETQKACQWLVDVIRGDEAQASIVYYEDTLALYYAVARAGENGVNTLQNLGPEITAKIRARYQADGTFGDEANTAFALTALLCFHADCPELLETCAGHLLQRQCEDGSWPILPLWHGPEPPAPPSTWFGCEELTTGICVEALARYARYQETRNGEHQEKGKAL